MIVLKRTSTIFLFFIVLLCGCSNTTSSDKPNDSGVSITQTSTNYQQEASQQAKRLIANEHEINEIFAVNNDKLLVIGVDPKQHDRLQLKELRKTFKEILESNGIKQDIELSTDQKIILELRKLEEQLDNGALSKKQLNKELERIQKLSKEQT